MTVRRDINRSGGPPPNHSSPEDRLYRRMVEMAWDAIVIHNGGRIHYANPCFRKSFHFPDSQPLDLVDFYSLFSNKTRQDLIQAQNQPLDDSTGPSVFQGLGIRANGVAMPIDLYTIPARYKGRPAFQTVIRDITDRKRMEERLILVERLAATGKLAFDIAHEINNPLGGAITYLHLLMEDLEEGASREQLKDSAEKILRLANRCRIIVGALLDFARDDRKGRCETDINIVVRETLSLLKGHLVMNGLDVKLNLTLPLPHILADPLKIGQVLTNLIVNAAESMEGDGVLTIASKYDPQTHFVYVQVSDTGPGIPAEHFQKIFEPFYTTKPRGRGTGLGLAISHGIIKQHHGLLEAHSTPNHGATFTVKLPAIREEDEG